MGYVLGADLETNLGPTDEMYCRIESFTFNKLTAELGFQVTYWLNRDVALKSNRIFVDDEIKNQRGLISNRVISFERNKNGDEIILEQFLVFRASTLEEINIPIYEKQSKTKEIPYISFDEEGNEITLYRTIQVEDEVQVGTRRETKEVIDYGLLKDIYGFMYKKLGEYLSESFSNDSIKNI
jgi:hypothetical protein